MTKIDTNTEAIAKLLDGVTKGPWTWEAESGDWPDNSLVDANGDPVMWVDFDLGFRFSTEANARFIPVARDLVPALTAERDALRAAAERMAESLRWYAGNVCNCNRHGSDGDMARDRLANDIGNRARAALAAWEAANA